MTSRRITMDFFLGGYYLLKPKPLSFGSRTAQAVLTASGCINDNLIGFWAYPWDKKARKDSAHAQKVFGLDRAGVDAVRQWVGEKSAANLVGWESVFFDTHTAIEYKETFFSRIGEAVLLAIYFNEDQREQVITEFRPESEKYGEIGVYQMLLKRMIERDVQGEELIGFDLIGMEMSGDFHSFHCHDMADELITKFGLVLNQFGLFDEPNSWHEILNYMNDEETGCEPAPWYVAKVKEVNMPR